MNNAFLKSYQTLQEIFSEQSFSSIALNKALSFCKPQEKALVTKLVYGVLDNDILLQYIISKYVKKLPKGAVLLFLKMGVYCLKELSIPVYAVVNDIAELAKLTGDKRQVGFVNATLKHISATISTFDDYPTDFAENLSVRYSYPLWAVKKVIKDYGKEVAEQIISFKPQNATTMRFVGNLDCQQLSQEYGVKLTPTIFDDAFVVEGKLPQLDSNCTIQSLSSMAISRICAGFVKSSFLDSCSAPGGKGIYLKQLCPNVDVTCCDIHPHRVGLINSYASRMNTAVTTKVADMTQLDETMVDKFDTVLCDVPCSGFGVLDNRPDIKLFRQNEDISSLMKLQQAILQNCSKYVAVGGHLIYSTCTIFYNENGQNIKKFLNANPNFQLSAISLPQFPPANGQGTYQFLPHKDGIQGFYVAVLQRIS